MAAKRKCSGDKMPSLLVVVAVAMLKFAVELNSIFASGKLRESGLIVCMAR